MKPATFKHIFEQGPMLRALGTQAIGAIRGPSSKEKPATPGPWIDGDARAPSAELIDRKSVV